MVKNLTAIQETQLQPLGQEDHLEKGMANHSSILAWRIPQTKLYVSCKVIKLINSKTYRL